MGQYLARRGPLTLNNVVITTNGNMAENPVSVVKDGSKYKLVSKETEIVNTLN